MDAAYYLIHNNTPQIYFQQDNSILTIVKITLSFSFFLPLSSFSLPSFFLLLFLSFYLFGNLSYPEYN